MRIGQFFSLQNSRVGQYLSERVLVVRTPFKPGASTKEYCCFGFPKLSQAQKFTQYLASLGYRFQLRQSQILQQYPYEVQLWGHAELARVLAYWDRLDQKQATAASTRTTPGKTPPKPRVLRDRLASPAPTIAA